MGGGPVSILSNNCLAGLIYHDLGVRFDSPTINLWIPLPAFVTFMENLDEALKADIAEVNDSELPYPVGRMVIGSGHEEIPIHFMHYHDFHAAVDQWRRRCGRVNVTKLVIVASENSSCTDDVFRRFGLLPFPKLLFSHSKHTAEVLGHDAFYMQSESGLPRNVTDFCGYFGYRVYHRVEVPETLFRLLSQNQQRSD